jgi:DNA repair exonuclease SbcCD nuclease subunit
LNRPVSEHIANWIRSLPEMPGYDVNLRTVLVAHLNVTGADVGRGMFRVNEASNVLLDAAALPTGFDYIALGHVHKPQRLRDQDHVRYSGSLDRMDHGDDDTTKEIVLVDIGPHGRRSVVPIQIEPTRLITATITAAETAAEQLAAQVPDPASALVRVVVEPAAASAGAAIDLAIRDALSAVTTVEWRPPETDSGQQAPIVLKGNTVRERVLGYLADRIPADDSERDALLALAVHFLDREAHR